MCSGAGWHVGLVFGVNWALAHKSPGNHSAAKQVDEKDMEMRKKTWENIIFEQMVFQSMFATVKACLFGQVEALKTLGNTWKYMAL